MSTLTETSAAMVAPDYTSKPISALVSLSGRVAVVTGGAGGIGKAIASRLSEAGARVVVADLNQDSAEAVAAELKEKWRQEAWGLRLDVTESNLVADAASRAAELGGKLDIWVNAAGIYPVRPYFEIDDAFWDNMMAINLRGTMVGAREAAKLMAPNRSGVIVNIASIASMSAGAPGSATYTASKHAVAGLTKSMAVEFGALGIRALGIAPAAIITPGLEELKRQFAKDIGGDFLEMLTERVHLGRPGLPDDIARVALFCASDLSAYMTGSLVVVDGGHMSM
ncbi:MULTISPECIES: SDR family NAD(P)-dependent oxidoreductase [unclassified Rhizobium]|uniref:SDR family NAD(P)-dependent oxidoreductase n=1 Tax=unclassified Rhizobium TaxID=2613769 RepID=UPI000BD8759E|nr:MULTISPECIES: SDR family oxidoreductase [unclassified Rhizobium]MDH7809595.1 NAD(P)-dependent dehydrogenase (short-subunit alcohol dehydrogenase family) [Rhizobium sp. AN67]MDQ4408828.1 SDR family oxidoreductase [Rhizobium sp. AN63]SOD50582.1 Enoyl-(Acyl carrier protein) reductase [Rhizobium sp. AN6A]